MSKKKEDQSVVFTVEVRFPLSLRLGSISSEVENKLEDLAAGGSYLGGGTGGSYYERTYLFRGANGRKGSKRFIKSVMHNFPKFKFGKIFINLQGGSVKLKSVKKFLLK